MKANQKNNTTTYHFNIDGMNVFVTLKHINNANSGNPRFEASVFTTNYGSESTCNGYPYTNYEGKPNHSETFTTHTTYNYTFSGHYMSDWNEAFYIANYHYERVICKA